MPPQCSRTSTKLLNPTYKTFKLSIFPHNILLYNVVITFSVHKIGKERTELKMPTLP